MLFDERNVVLEIEKHGLPGGVRDCGKRNVFDKGMLFLEAWATRGGVKFCIGKRNVFDRRNVVLESTGCQRGGGGFE